MDAHIRGRRRQDTLLEPVLYDYHDLAELHKRASHATQLVRVIELYFF
jgi:hypothetical protein